MIVRRLRPDETKLLKDLRLRALADAPDAFARTHAEIAGQPQSYWDEMMRSVTAPDRHVMFVAEDDGGAPVGMAFGIVQSDTPDTPHLGGMWVDGNARLRGAGTALTVAVVDWARERGFHRIALWVTEGNGPATSLYERMGFTATGRTDRFPPNPALGILEMARAL